MKITNKDGISLADIFGPGETENERKAILGATWYAKTTNTGSAHEQGLIIDEETGANIAVSYDPRHARLIAAAPELLEACQMMLVRLEGIPEAQCPRGLVYDLARASIAKAEGRAQ